MNKIIGFFKFLVFCFMFSFAMWCGIFFNKIENQKNHIKKDSDGIHKLCRSNLEGKIAGKPCSMCKLKWTENKSPKKLEESILKFAEKKYGKNIKDFTNGETKELYYMMRDIKIE